LPSATNKGAPADTTAIRAAAKDGAPIGVNAEQQRVQARADSESEQRGEYDHEADVGCPTWVAGSPSGGLTKKDASAARPPT
jgi:hypothetical protein